jgi:pSer/pThr/pTyr-binding forkhead associated (FHA) protein
MSVFSLLLFLSFSPKASAADGKDYVIVIDVSTSMQDTFDEVKRLTNRTLSEAHPGDTVVIITFGERATLLDRKQIRGKSDIEALQQQVNALYASDYATYINGGMEKSLSELRYLFEKFPERERVLLWLSDDKDNPPTQLGDQYVSLDELRKKSSNFEPGREWFAYQAPLSEVKNDRLEDFVSWARRTTYRIGIKEAGIDLGSFDKGPVEKKIVLTFEPLQPGAAGLAFFTGATLVDPANPEKTIPVTFSPNRVVASDKPWRQEFDISFAGEPGEYHGEVSFQSLSGPVLDVTPQKLTLTAMVVQPKPLEEVVQPPEAQKLEAVVASAKEAPTGRPAGMDRPQKPLTFGPLEPGKKDTKMITLYLNKEADADSISQNLSIQVPKGFSVASKIFGKRDTKLAAEITISVDQETEIPEEYLMQGAYEGSIHFVSKEAGVEILPLLVPIRIEMSTDRVRWGKKLLPPTVEVGRAQASRMTFDELTRELGGKEKGKENPIVSTLRAVYSKAQSRYVLFPLIAGLVVLFVVLLYRFRPVNELFIGELVVIKDPSNSKTKNINLKRVGSLHSKDMLTVGSSPTVDIRLNHPSVSPIHCRLSAKRNENQVEVSVLPAKGNSLKVNDVETLAKARLSDKDLLGIGEFILLFSNPETQKQVVVHFLDGRTMRGTPVTWDIGASSFELLRTDVEGLGETAEEIAAVAFDTLKGVFFLQDPTAGASIPRDRIRHKELFEITFFDGEKIEGNPLTDYSDLSGRFYLVPKEMPNIVSILIERRSIKEMTKREDRGEPETAAGVFGSFKGRKRAAPAD